MLLLNVDPKTPSHCHMDLACRRNFVSKSCFSCHRINQLTIKPLEKKHCLWVLSVPQYLDDICQRLSVFSSSNDHLRKNKHPFLIWWFDISDQNGDLFQIFYHDNHHPHLNHHDLHDHHHSNHLKKTNSSPSLAFPVLWVWVQSLQHVKRLVVMMMKMLMMKIMMMLSNAWCWSCWWWYWWWWWLMRRLISMIYDNDKHLRRRWFLEQFLL